jgi:hypothetical protein
MLFNATSNLLHGVYENRNDEEWKMKYMFTMDKFCAKSKPTIKDCILIPRQIYCHSGETCDDGLDLNKRWIA